MSEAVSPESAVRLTSQIDNENKSSQESTTIDPTVQSATRLHGRMDSGQV